MIFIVIFSFYLEGILSKVTNTTFLIPLTTLMSLIIIYPFCNKMKKEYYLICFIIGLIYDIAYTNTLFLNACLFLLIGYLINLINIIITNNIFNVMIIGLIIIIIYRILNYFILVFIDYLEYDITLLIKSILSSILLNLLYVGILYKIIDKISKKYRIYKKD
mgnify:CR=1 FL=1